MTDQQMMFLLEKKFTGCQLLSVIFGENGNMTVKFFDTGGNFHHQVLTAQKTLETKE